MNRKLFWTGIILTLICALSWGAPINSRALPDTGLAAGFTTTFGEDCDYTINPPSFTDNKDGTVTDNVTGLVWQKADGGR